ncbi:MAG: ABC transporter permease [Bacteroidota bacterium]|jgi:putative ABC transport system permease protein
MRSKSYTLINLTGLAIGLTAVILIFLYLKFQFSYDDFQKKSDNLFRISVVFERKGIQEGEDHVFVPPIGPAMLRDFPEVKNYTRIRTPRTEYFLHDDLPVRIDLVACADSTFFDLFSFRLLEGDPKTALVAPYSIVLTRTVADKIFGHADPVGSTLADNNNRQYTVTGIVEDPPLNSQIQFSALISFESLYQDPHNYMDWNGGNQYITYVELSDGSLKKNVESKFPDFMWKYINKDLSAIGIVFKPYLQPLRDVHLYYEGDSQNTRTNVYVFSAVAVFILLLACINFINLSTARANRRSMEVGIRKVLGAHRGSLIKQFLAESMLLSVIAMIAALLLVELLIPVFDRLVNEKFSLFSMVDYKLFAGLAVIIIFTGLVAGFYPAFVLSSYQPVKVLRKSLSDWHGKYSLRGLLVIFQFAISIGLIISTLLINTQINYIKNKQLGFDKENILILPLANDQLRNSAEALKHELYSIPGVKNVTASSEVPGYGFTSNGYFPEGVNSPMMINVVDVDDNFLNTFNLTLVGGRNFRQGSQADKNAYLVNETLAKTMGWKDPLGKFIQRDGRHEVIGVVKDFHFASLHEEIKPLIVTNIPWGNQFSVLSVKLISPDLSRTMGAIENVWKKFAPQQVFEYNFLDEAFDLLYKGEQRFRELFLYFSVLAIVIALLGLFGLASFIMEQKTKEIAIRKIHGATVPGITVLMAVRFARWVLVANVLAWPAAYLFINHWLNDFAYRIGIDFWVFVFAALTTLSVALLTVGYHSIKASLANPVDSLRYE